MPVSKKRKKKSKKINKNKNKNNITRTIKSSSTPLVMEEYRELESSGDKANLYKSTFTEEDYLTIKTILKNEELSDDFDKKAYSSLSQNTILSKYNKDMLLDKYEVKDICDMSEDEIKVEREYLEQELELNNLNLFDFIKVDYHTDAVDNSTNFYIRNLIYHRHVRGLVNSKYRNKSGIVDRVCEEIINTSEGVTPIANNITLHKVKPFTVNMFGDFIECDTIYVTTESDEHRTKTTMCYYIER